MTGWLSNLEQSPFKISFGEENFPWSSDKTVQKNSTRGASGIPGARVSPFFGDEVRQQHAVSDGDTVAPGYGDDHKELLDTEEWENAILTPSFINILQHTESDITLILKTFQRLPYRSEMLCIPEQAAPL